MTSKKWVLLPIALIIIFHAKKGLACSYYSGLFTEDKGVSLIRSSIKAPPRTFNSATSALPASYTGLDPYLVWKILKASQSQKAEYETTDQFERRKNLTPPYEIKYGYNTSHSLPFVADMETSDLFGPSFFYDADNKKLVYEVKSSYSRRATGLTLRPEGLGFESGSFGVLVQDRTIRNTYIGTNAFGVKAEVVKYVSCQIEIRFPSPAGLSADEYAKNSITLGIPSSIQQAKQIKEGKTSAVYILTPAEPYIQDDEYSSSDATISWPTESRTIKHIIFGRLDGILIMDKASGRILGSRFFGN